MACGTRYTEKRKIQLAFAKTRSRLTADVRLSTRQLHNTVLLQTMRGFDVLQLREEYASGCTWYPGFSTARRTTSGGWLSLLLPVMLKGRSNDGAPAYSHHRRNDSIKIRPLVRITCPPGTTMVL